MKLYDKLDDKLIAFMKAQKMFFVATAPNAEDGHINVSPKGYDSLAIIDETTIAYIDLGGSGIETQAHVQENGRITIMYCAFEGKANIMRLYGQGEVFDFNHPEFAGLMTLFPGFDRARAIFKIKLTQIQDSCGWGVPFYEFKGERDQLKRSHEIRTDEEWKAHRLKTNAVSLDGLPGLIRPKS